MPEIHFAIEWPNGVHERCYSPSTVVLDHLTEGEDYAVAEFMARAARGLHAASDRVQARYGFACSSALDQLARLQATAASLSPAEQQGRVKVLAFERHAPRDARAKPAPGDPQGERT